MKRILIFSGVLFLSGLASCHFFGQKKKGIVAEIISTGNSFSANENAMKENDSAEVIRLKNLVLNPELLYMSIHKSKFPHTIEEVKAAVYLDNPENTSIVDIYYSGNDTAGATAFLDTLLNNLENFEVAPRLNEMDKEIGRVQFQLDSVTAVLNGFENFQDSTGLAQNSEDIYEKLLERRATLSIRKAGIVSTIRILFWAHPVFPEE